MSYARPYADCHAKVADALHDRAVQESRARINDLGQRVHDAQKALREAERALKQEREVFGRAVMSVMGVHKGDKLACHDSRFGPVVFEFERAVLKDGKVVNLNGPIIEQPPFARHTLKRYGANYKTEVWLAESEVS